MSSSRFLLRLLLCIFFFGVALYHVIHRHNYLTQLRIELPALQEELRFVQDSTQQLQFEQERLLDPKRLLEQLPDHLQAPERGSVWVFEEGAPLDS